MVCGPDTSRMWITWVSLGGAGLIAGMSGTVTGIGSVFSYPALLAVGLPATAANVTNTVSLALGGVGGMYGSRPELAGHAATVRRLCLACALGSVLGSVLLLTTPPDIFGHVVPFLVGGASASILLPRRRPNDDGTADPRATRWRTNCGVIAASIYNGYFAAAGGVLIIAVLLATTRFTLTRINAFKNAVIVVSDLAATITFAIFGPVSWTDVPPLAIGLLAGSWIGPSIARRLPPGKLRLGIALVGLGLAVKLGTGTLS